MIKEAKNKAVQNSETKEEVKTVEVEQDYFFPDYQLTIKAVNLQEAEKKLAEIIANK